MAKNLGIITIGDEVVEGRIIESNSLFLSDYFEKNYAFGTLIKMSVVDQKTEIKRALNYLSQSSCDLIVCTGGLGPTVDDLTLEAAAEFFSLELEKDENAAKNLAEVFKKRQRQILPEHLKMVHYLKGSQAIENPVGIALGSLLHFNQKDYLFLPGVPAEMKGMLAEKLPKILAQHCLSQNLLPEARHVFKFVGLSESEVDRKFKDLGFPYFHILDKPMFIEVSIKESQIPSPYKFAELTKLVKENFDTHLIPETYQGPEEWIIKMSSTQGWKISCVESCTGGLLMSSLLSVPGASKVFQRGWVAYDKKAKIEELSLEPELIENIDEVSWECALEMAEGALKNSQADFSISVTGLAGPEGDGSKNEVGTVYVGISDRIANTTQVRHFFYPTSREVFRQRVVRVAIHSFIAHILKYHKQTLLMFLLAFLWSQNQAGFGAKSVYEEMNCENVLKTEKGPGLGEDVAGQTENFKLRMFCMKLLKEKNAKRRNDEFNPPLGEQINYQHWQQEQEASDYSSPIASSPMIPEVRASHPRQFRQFEKHPSPKPDHPMRNLKILGKTTNNASNQQE